MSLLRCRSEVRYILSSFLAVFDRDEIHSERLKTSRRARRTDHCMGRAAFCLNGSRRAALHPRRSEPQSDFVVHSAPVFYPHRHVDHGLRSDDCRSSGRGILSGSWWSAFRVAADEDLARWNCLVWGCAHWADHSLSARQYDSRCSGRGFACALVRFPRDVWVWSRQPVLDRLRFSVRRGARLARIRSATVAAPLWRPESQHLYWIDLEHMASLDGDHSGRSVAGDSRGCGCNLHAADLNRDCLCLDVQQHQRELVSGNGVAHGAQSRWQHGADSFSWIAFSFHARYSVPRRRHRCCSAHALADADAEESLDFIAKRLVCARCSENVAKCRNGAHLHSGLAAVLDSAGPRS